MPTSSSGDTQGDNFDAGKSEVIKKIQDILLKFLMLT